MPTLYKGQTLTKDDLNIYIQDETGQYVSPFSITYTIYWRVVSYSGQIAFNEEVLRETIDTVPIPFGIGKFFAAWNMPQDIRIGKYRIKWNIKRYPDTPILQRTEEFEIVARSCLSAEASVGEDGALADSNLAQYFTGGCAG